MGASGSGNYGDFGGLNFTPGPLVYENGQFRVQETWNEVNSYNSKYGVTNGSTYFSFIDIGKQFDSRGSSFDQYSGDINNANPMSFDIYTDWRVPTRDELKKLIGTGNKGIARNGSTVNGNTGKHYSRITTNIGYAGAYSIQGYIFFPDDKVITGRSLSRFDSTINAATGVTSDELNEYLKQGCIFLPYCGHFKEGMGWINSNRDSLRWSATYDPTNQYGAAYCLRSDDPVYTESMSLKTGFMIWLPVILCRQI